MGKMIGITEFKAKCLQLIDAMERDGEPITITKRGRVVAQVVPEKELPRRNLKPAFGMLRSDRYRFDVDPSVPAADPDDWDALR